MSFLLSSISFEVAMKTESENGEIKKFITTYDGMQYEKRVLFKQILDKYIWIKHCN